MTNKRTDFSQIIIQLDTHSDSVHTGSARQ